MAWHLFAVKLSEAMAGDKVAAFYLSHHFQSDNVVTSYDPVMVHYWFEKSGMRSHKETANRKFPRAVKEQVEPITVSEFEGLRQMLLVLRCGMREYPSVELSLCLCTVLEKLEQLPGTRRANNCLYAARGDIISIIDTRAKQHAVSQGSSDTERARKDHAVEKVGERVAADVRYALIKDKLGLAAVFRQVQRDLTEIRDVVGHDFSALVDSARDLLRRNHLLHYDARLGHYGVCHSDTNIAGFIRLG